MSVPRVVRGAALIARCESCGAAAAVELEDGSLLCWPCHTTALDLSYDTDDGTVLP